MYGNFRELEDGSKELAVRVNRWKSRGGMPTSARRLIARLVRKAPVEPYGRVLDGVKDCELGRRG